MSLAGYMPPLCDAKDGHLLLDGGYVNNLPGKMLSLMFCFIFVAIWLSEGATSLDVPATLALGMTIIRDHKHFSFYYVLHIFFLFSIAQFILPLSLEFANRAVQHWNGLGIALFYLS